MGGVVSYASAILSICMPVLELTNKGLYSPSSDIYIDPWAPVRRALITHAHADHARSGSERYLAHHKSIPVMRYRLGGDPVMEGLGYGEPLVVNGVKFSLHPAGHVPGSSQIRVQERGEVWVVSGDYKLENDGVCEPFEPIKCNTFISECTFGMPIFRWRPQIDIAADINAWWQNNKLAGRTSIITAYALGKAQRLIKLLDRSIGPLIIHSSIAAISRLLNLDPIAEDDRTEGRLVVVPPSIIKGRWIERYSPYTVAAVSGWMSIRGMKRRAGVDRGFALSDHADFDGLYSAIRSTEAERVLLTHGYTAQFARYLRTQALNAEELDLQHERGEDD